MHLNRLICLVCALLAGNSVAEEDIGPGSWWWDSDWWDESRIEIPYNYRVETEWVSYDSNGVDIPALVARPAGDNRYPAVVFFHGRRGLDELVQRHVRRIAARGFVVLAPDVYGAHFLGTHPVEHDYALEADFNGAVDVLMARDDISSDSACAYSHTRGGYYSLKVATTFGRQAKDLSCYVSYYPHLQDPNAPEPQQVYGYASEIDDLELPTLVFIGEDEQYQRRRVIETSIDVMKSKGRDARLVIYPGVGRGFDFRPENVRTFADDMASKDAVQRASKFMRTHLEKPASSEVAEQEGGEPSMTEREVYYNSDNAPGSALFNLPQEVIPSIWSAIGATAPGTYGNSGHNNNLSFVITNDGVLVVNAGDNYLLAKALHDEIKKVTDQPVKYVVLENGQGHAMLGSNYWKEQGVPVIAHIDAAHEIEEQSFALLEVMQERAKEKAAGTEVVMPDKTFEDRMVIEMGGERIELLNLGPAHSPGDIIVWLPNRKLVISGDMAFHERMLPLFGHTDPAAWIETWDDFEALGAEVVIPGHGGPTDMPTVRKYTRDYLVYLREKVGEVIDNGGGLHEAYEVDQSPYMHLHTSEFLAKRNAGHVFQMMEFEF